MLCETLQVHERQRSLLLPPSRHGTGHADSRQTWMNPPYSPTLSLQTSVPQRCRLQCRCRCHSHKRSNMQTPRWLQPIMGAFIVNYNSIPILDLRSCNVNSCHSGRSSFSLVYYFPKWVIARGIHVTTSWSSLIGAGASLHLHVPIVIDDNHDIWVYIRINDVNYLRGCIERRNIPSSAVDSYGEPLLLLCLAIRNRSWQACGLLFTSGYNTSLRDHYGATPYSAAIYRLQLRCFLRPKPRLGPDDNAPDSILSRIAGIASDELIHSTPLHDSILNLNTLPLDKSLAADPTAMDDWDEAGITPLIWAIDTENEAAVKFLISNGANIEKTDAFGDAPLTQAGWINGDVGLRVAQALLEAGCDPNVRSSDGSTPIFRSRSYAMTKLLLASGADSNIINSNGWSVLSYLAYGGTLLDDLDDYPKVITTLIAAGADINGTDVDGNAPIKWTVGKYNHSHESDGYRFKYFHQQGAKLDVISQYQQTILHYASRYGQLEVVEYIRSIELAGVDPDKEDVWSYTATDDLARVSDQTIRTRAWERRPTRA
ncbi:Ankyrin repeat-containing domain protein [Rhypophila decipiens]